MVIFLLLITVSASRLWLNSTTVSTQALHTNKTSPQSTHSKPLSNLAYLILKERSCASNPIIAFPNQKFKWTKGILLLNLIMQKQVKKSLTALNWSNTGKITGRHSPCSCITKAQNHQTGDKSQELSSPSKFNECYSASLRLRLRSYITCGNSGQVIYCWK